MAAPDETRLPAARPTLRRRVLVGVSSMMMGRLLSMASLFGIAMVLARRFDDAEMAAYVLASFLVPFISHFVNMGTTDILLRIVRRSHLDGDPQLTRYGVAACLKLLAVNTVIYTILFIVGSRLLAMWRPQTEWTLVSENSLWISLWVLLFSYSQGVAELFRGRDGFWMSSAMYSKSGGWMSNTLTLAAVGAGVLAWGDLSLPAVLEIHVAALAISMAVGTAAALRIEWTDGAADRPQAGAARAGGEIPARPATRWLLRETWPLFVSAGVLLTIEQVDVFAISLFASAGTADYGLAKWCLGIINFGFVTLGHALMPFVAELCERGETQKLERMMRGAATLIGIPCVALSLVLFVGADVFATLAFGPDRAGMALPLRILLLGQAFLFLAGHGNIVLLMAGRQRELMRSTLVVGAVYAVMLPVAIYGWGMAGAAVAKSLASAERAVAAAMLTRRLLNVRTTSGFSPAMIKEALALFRKRGPRRGGDQSLANAEA